MPTPTLIGLDIGGTKCALSVPDGDDRVREVARFTTGDPQSTLEQFFAAIDGLARVPSPVFGVSCGGPLDPGRGVILSPPNLPGWDNIAICTQLTARYGGRAFLMNDANASALAEGQFGAARGCRHFVFLTMGTGMGAGLVLNGQLYEGAGGDAGEVGHWRLAPDGPLGFGKHGSFEGFCSGGGIARLARDRVAAFPGRSLLKGMTPESLTARSLHEAAAARDTLAIELWSELGEHLGQGLALIIDAFNPERIVIGGLFPRCERFIAPAMRAAIEREALPSAVRACRVVPAELGETIGSYAAIAVARYQLSFSNPTAP
jgi:glucokinase